MKKHFALAAAAAFIALIIAGPAEAQMKPGFRLSGGAGYVGGGDMNAGLKGWSDAWNKLWALYAEPTTGGYESFHLGADVSAEFMLQFGKHFGASLGIGYLSASKSSRLALVSDPDVFYTWNPKVSAVPVTATFYFFLPIGSRMKVFLAPGLGYYFATASDIWQYVYYGSFKQDIEATSGGLGPHLGVGIEYDLTPKIGFIAEFRGRYASFAGFEGESLYNGGTPIAGEYWYSDKGYYLWGEGPLVVFGPVDPSGAGYTYREAKIDFSGFSVVIGVIVRI